MCFCIYHGLVNWTSNGIFLSELHDNDGLFGHNQIKEKWFVRFRT